MFNIFFDVATAYLVAGFLYIALPITVWFVMGSGRLKWTPNLGQVFKWDTV